MLNDNISADNKDGSYFLDEFFVIDSFNLDTIKSRLYGYCISDVGVVEDDNLDIVKDFQPDGTGAYVFVKQEGNSIHIEQDFNGCYGLYLFQKGSYFALSNSFLLLQEYLKDFFPLSLNKDFANYFIVASLCSMSFSETLINEIKVLRRDAVIDIDIEEKDLHITYKDYKEHSVSINSEEGIALLDRWFEKWTNLIRAVKKQTNNIQADLSGGFDSRMTFALILGSGININEVNVHSINDNLSVHAEDFAIASKIADFYGFRLNQSSNLIPGRIPRTRGEIIALSFYPKLGFHKQFYFKRGWWKKVRFSITGEGGECIRGYNYMEPSTFLRNQLHMCRKIGSGADALSISVVKVIERAFDEVREKCPVSDEKMIPYHLYAETRCRNHYGKSIIENYLGNTIVFSPLIDSNLRKLIECGDASNLIPAVVYSRYSENLLDFPFEGRRFIPEAAVKLAKEINARYPFKKNSSEKVLREFLPISNCLLQKKAGRSGTEKIIKDVELLSFLDEVYASREFHDVICKYLDEDVYDWILKDRKERSYFPLTNVYAVIAMYKAIKDVWVSRYPKGNKMQWLSDVCRFGFYSRFSTARLDIRLQGNEIEVVDVSDGVKCQAPAWFSKEGQGIVFESQRTPMGLTIKCLASGVLQFWVRGINYKDSEGKRLPIRINCQKLVVNGKEVNGSPRVVWHDNPLRYSCDVRLGEVIKVCLEWQPRVA